MGVKIIEACFRDDLGIFKGIFFFHYENGCFVYSLESSHRVYSSEYT